MTTSPILAFIDSRIHQSHRKAKIRRRRNNEKGKRLDSARSAVPQKTTIGSYIYAIVVDGVVRYIGKGRNGRMYTHLVEAKRTSARCPADTAHLYPRMHRKLVETVRAGSRIIETVITSGLTDRAAYRLESRMIGEFHKFRAGQLWNTIDERFLDPRYLPDEWDDPEHPLYRLPRVPLVMSKDETRRLSAIASSLKARVRLSLGYGCGLRAGEVVRLKVKYIDSAQNIIRVEQSKKSVVRPLAGGHGDGL